LAHDLDSLTGGIRDFPGAWNVSDHAPVVAQFNSQGVGLTPQGTEHAETPPS
jgi:hypothetical protein